MSSGAGTCVCPGGLGGGGGEGQADITLCELAARQAIQLCGSLGRARRPALALDKERVLHQDLQ